MRAFTKACELLILIYYYMNAETVYDINNRYQKYSIISVSLSNE
jgi:hypothetical protein